MSFREKSAWITLASLVLLTVLLLLHLGLPDTLAPGPSPWLFHILLASILVFIVIEIIAHIVMAIRSPRDARTPKDERERLIELRSRSVAYYFYAITSIGSVFVSLHAGANEIGIGYLLLACLVAAQIVNYALRVYYYRRGF